MRKGWWYQFIFFVLLTVASVMAVIPAFFNVGESYPVKSRLTLGLDLQGGLYMILGIDFPKAYRDEITSYARKMEYLLSDDGIKSKLGSLDSTQALDPKHSIVLEKIEDVTKAKDKIRSQFSGTIRLTGESGTTLTYGLANAIRSQIEEQAVGKSIEVIRNRIDEFGVAEPEILSQGKDRIIVQLPGVKDIERAKELIGQTAKLEFKMVNDTVDPSKFQSLLNKIEEAGLEYKAGDSFSRYVISVNELLAKDLPEGYELAFEKTISKLTNEVTIGQPYLVETAARLTGDDLQDARVQMDPQKNQPFVSLEFKTSGAKIFEEVTGASIGKRMAIILDGNVYSAPVIQSKIPGGRAQITLGGAGGYNKMMQEARDLALVLRAGALPVQLDFLEQRVVGPSLGSDSIDKAVWSGTIGCIVLFVFMIIYYRFGGIVTVATLMLNVLFVIACLVGFEATLTLPGIAGIALTIAMAADGNIIVIERIREELRKGSTVFKSFENGFNHAFWTILDANITTALSGICLLNFGTGPIRGFAVTLLIGLCATVYTSYFVNKLFVEFYITKTEGKSLSV